MGLFDFLKPKKHRIDELTFSGAQYQREILAFARMHYEENGHNYGKVTRALAQQGLSVEQRGIIIENLRWLNARGADPRPDSGPGQSVDIRIIPDPGHKKGSADTEEVDRYIGFGAYQMERGAYDNALELFDNAIELDPNAPLAYANKGTLYSKLGDERMALVFYDKALALDPNNKLIYENKALTCEALGDIPGMKACFTELLRLDPGDIESAFALSNCHVQSNEFAEALPLLNRIIESAPDPEMLHGPQLSKIGVLLELGRDGEAHALYLEMARRFPQDQDIHHIIPSLLWFKDRKADALGFFDRIRNESGDERIQRLKADFLYTRDPEQAVVAYDDWLAAHPDDIPAREFRLAMLAQTGDGSRIEAETDRLLELSPHSVAGLQFRVRQLFAAGEHEAALAMTERIFSLNTDDVDFVSLYIEIAGHFNTEAEVIALIDGLKAKYPQQAYNIDFRKGLYFKSTGAFSKAVGVFEQLNREQNFAWNHYQIGIIRNLEGNVPAALEYLEAAIRLDPAIRDDARQYHELQNLRSDARFIRLAGL